MTIYILSKMRGKGGIFNGKVFKQLMWFFFLIFWIPVIDLFMWRISNSAIKCNSPGLRRHLEHDGVHDKGHKLWHHVVNVQLIQLQKNRKKSSVHKDLTILLHIIVNDGIYLADYNSPNNIYSSVFYSVCKCCMYAVHYVLSQLQEHRIYLIHQHNYDGQLCKHLQRQRSLWYDCVL